MFKTVDGLELRADVYSPINHPASPRPVCLYLHGGFLITGTRSSFAPYWLFNALVSRGWTCVSPDYRLIPETNLLAAIEDLKDAWKWIETDLAKKHVQQIDLGRRIVAGSSAGGLLAAICGTVLSPLPKVVVPIYGMLDAAGDVYLNKGWRPMSQPEIDPAPLLERLRTNHTVVAGHEPANSNLPPTADHRHQYIIVAHQEALFPDWMTGEPGMTKRIRERGVQAIPEKYHCLYPLSFGITPNYPATMIIHGDADTFVHVEHSIEMDKRLNEEGVKHELAIFKGAEHGFDGRLGDINVDLVQGDNEEAQKLAQCWQQIESWTLA